MKLKRIQGTILGITRKHFVGAAAMALTLGFGVLAAGSGSVCWAQQSVTVYPGQNIQSIVNSYPGSTTFYFTPGIYYLQSIVPKSYDSFQGQSGAILSGAEPLTNFTQTGSYWTAQVPVTQQSSYPGHCGPNPACIYPEDLFFNNVPKYRVSSMSALGPGTWYLDYGTGTAYIGDNPWGQSVEISILPQAFTGAETNVSINGLIIEKYACVGGTGAVNAGAGSNYWSIGGDEIRFNHGFGIQTGDGTYIYNNNIHNNGEEGVAGEGSNLLVQNNTIAYNNYAGYTIYNEAGGAKFSNAQNVTFLYNSVHDNYGPGFWTDVNTQNVICNGNQFSANQIAGIFLEISNGISVFNNYVWNDGYNSAGPYVWDGAGILISNSSNVSIYFNHVTNSMNGIVGLLASRGNAPNGQPYLLQNVNVNSNWITQSTGVAAGIYIENGNFDNSVYTSWNNTMRYNNFYLSNPNGNYFCWLGQYLTLNGFGTLLASL